MKIKPIALMDIFSQIKTVRIRVRDTNNLRDFLIVHRLNPMWVIGIDLEHGSQIKMMTTIEQYARLSSDEELEVMRGMSFSHLGKWALGTKSSRVQTLARLNINEFSHWPA